MTVPRRQWPGRSAASSSSPASSHAHSGERWPIAGPHGGSRSPPVSLLAVAAGALAIAADGPLWLSAIGTLALGLAAGLPFAVIFESAQRLRPDAPGAAIALVNACAVLAILIGTPLAGLAFDAPGDGAAAFVLLAVLALAALPALRHARL